MKPFFNVRNFSSIFLFLSQLSGLALKATHLKLLENIAADAMSIGGSTAVDREVMGSNPTLSHQ